MTTNREWLNRLAKEDPRALSEWMDAEHAERPAPCQPMADLMAELAELDARVDGLVCERDALARDLAESERLREQLRGKLGAACDHAHAVLATVDLDGEVAS